VAENIRLGRPRRATTRREAAERAQADEFIRALPDGYETVIGERGYIAREDSATAHRHCPRWS
jgi:ABC-type multidrug transport system fused ATPase/permease subunit